MPDSKLKEASAVKLAVPHVVQCRPANCGPTVLWLVSRFLIGEPDTVDDVERAADLADGKGMATVRLAVGAAKLGLQVSFTTASVAFNEAHLLDPFYHNYGDADEKAIEEVTKYALKIGVDVVEKRVPLSTILKGVTPTSVPIVLVDSNMLNGCPDRGYCGHFVPIVGYDDAHVYIHDTAVVDGKFLAVTRCTFDACRIAPGTDEDWLLVSKKPTTA